MRGIEPTSTIHFFIVSNVCTAKTTRIDPYILYNLMPVYVHSQQHFLGLYMCYRMYTHNHQLSCPCHQYMLVSQTQLYYTPPKQRAPGEDRTHDLQISLWSTWIMRLTRCLLRYRGRWKHRGFRNCWISVNIFLVLYCCKTWPVCENITRGVFSRPYDCIAQPINGHLPSISIQSQVLTLLEDVEQSGAVEACWAHNPEVRRSKLRSAKYFFIITNFCITQSPIQQKIGVLD